MATRLIHPDQQFSDSAGAPLAAATLGFFETGTSTPKNTYSDTDLTIANDNPIDLNSEGRLDVDVWGEGEFKLVVDPVVETVRTYDPLLGFSITSGTEKDLISDLTAILKATLNDGDRVTVKGYFVIGDGGGGDFHWDSSSAATANGGTVIASDEGGTGRWLRIHKNILTFRDFGVLPNGADQSVKVQEAIDECAANGFFLQGIDGTVVLDDTVDLESGLLAIGTGKDSSKFAASTTLGAKNLFSAVGKDGITFSGFGYDMRNDVTTGVGTDFVENALYFEDCTDIRVHSSDFTRDVMHSIMVRGTTTPGDSTDIFIHDNSFSNGARGAVDIRRYGKNVHIYRNTMLNVIDSTKSTGGVDFEKPIVVTGTVDAYIHHNSIEQTNGEGGAVICEFLTVESENIHIYKNTYIGANGSNAFKAADSSNIHMYQNKAVGTDNAGFNVSGCTNAWIYENHAEDCGDNSFIISSDVNVPQNIHLFNNYSKNANVNANTLGTPGADGSDENSYHIQVKGGGNHIYVYDNVMEDDAATANGIKFNADDIYVRGNDLTLIANGSPSSVIAMNNRAMDPATQTYRVWDNPGFPTTSRGTVDIDNPDTSVTVSPTIVINNDPGDVTITQRTVFNSTIAYAYVTDGSNSDFNIILRASGHGAPTNSGTVTFEYETDISRVFDRASAGI